MGRLARSAGFACAECGQDQSGPEAVLSTGQAATLLHVGENMVSRWCLRGRIPGVTSVIRRGGKAYRIPVRSIVPLAERRQRGLPAFPPELAPSRMTPDPPKDVPRGRPTKVCGFCGKPRDYFSVPEAAEILGLHRKIVQRACQTGRYPGVTKVDGEYRVPVNVVEILYQYQHGTQQEA